MIHSVIRHRICVFHQAIFMAQLKKGGNYDTHEKI